MARHSDNRAVLLPAIRTLASLFGDRIDFDTSDLECFPEALAAVVAPMTRFPESIILQQHACYALTMMVEHSAEAQLPDAALAPCATAATEALALVRGRCDSRRDSSSYNALYVRKEATSLKP